MAIEVIMKGNSKTLLLFMIIFLISSCGKAVNEIFNAPTTKNQTGIIASCTSKAVAEELATSQGIKFRVINEKRKLIEFIGISESELKILLPKAKLKQNKIYDGKLISGDFSAKAYIGNDPFYGAHVRDERSSNAGRYFPHLSQISALNVANQGEGVTIAIIDTGVYYNHPHLSPNIKTNSNDRHGSNANNSDDDNNGYKDDYVGWDFYNGDAYPNDDNGHGTHVAGLAASTYMGVAPKAKILPIKVLSSEGRGDLGTIAAGIMYAIDNGANIINMSLGGSGAGGITSDIRNMINSVKVAKSKNVLIIAAAGNGGNDGIGDCNDDSPVYPANISEDNMISVASVDEYNNLTDYSNFGGESVHVAAPGGDYFTGGLSSTAIAYCNGPCNQSNLPYVTMMGTSMATPVVAGMAAVLMSKNKSASYKTVRNSILNHCDRTDDLNGLVKCGGVVNVESSYRNL